MSPEQNIRLVQDIYAAYMRGDVQYGIDLVSDDLEEFGIVSQSPTGVPYYELPPARGKAAAVQFFEALGRTLEHLAVEPHSIAAAGDDVYATLRMKTRIRATGQPLDFPDTIHRFTFRDGKVVRFRAFEDTAHVAEAFKRPPEAHKS